MCTAAKTFDSINTAKQTADNASHARSGASRYFCRQNKPAKSSPSAGSIGLTKNSENTAGTLKAVVQSNSHPRMRPGTNAKSSPKNTRNTVSAAKPPEPSQRLEK